MLAVTCRETEGRPRHSATCAWRHASAHHPNDKGEAMRWIDLSSVSVPGAMRASLLLAMLCAGCATDRVMRPEEVATIAHSAGRGLSEADAWAQVTAHNPKIAAFFKASAIPKRLATPGARASDVIVLPPE